LDTKQHTHTNNQQPTTNNQQPTTNNPSPIHHSGTFIIEHHPSILNKNSIVPVVELLAAVLLKLQQFEVSIQKFKNRP